MGLWTRTRRAFAFVLRLNAAMFFAALIGCTSSWEDGEKLKDNVNAAERSSGDLFSEVSDAFSIPVVVPLALASKVVAEIFVGVCTVPPPLFPEGAGPNQSIKWWTTSRSSMLRNCLGFFTISMCCTISTLLVAALQPQP